MIEIKRLRHVYKEAEGRETEALAGIDLHIARGEFIAVIGANGSGKSTLARHLNALLLPTAGTCVIDGLDTAVEANLWEIRRRVGMVFQNPDNQIVAAIVEDDVGFGPENTGVPPEEIRVRIASALAAVDMAAYARHAPHLLSGGQKQRVAIAGVLALEPECIVLDEPTAMLDPRGRREILAIVHQLNREKGITVVYITHYMSEALAADRVVVMEQGRIALTGTPRQVFSRTAELERLGLEAPLAAKVAEKLRRSGLRIPEGIITDEELAQALCQ